MVGVLSPWPGLRTVYNAAMVTSTSQSANSSDLVNSTLLDLRSKPVISDGHTVRNFCTHFRDLFQQMLERKPNHRPSAVTALALTNKLLSKIESLFTAPNLVEVDRNQPTWSKAESLLVQLMETRKDILGEKHSGTLANMNNQASIYYSQGRF